MDNKLNLRSAVNLKDEIPWDILEQTLKDAVQMKVKSVIFSGGGEPLVYPYIKDALKFVVKNKIDFAMMTNGQLLKGDIAKLLHHAQWVRISLDACTADCFSKIRSVPKKNFDELIKNIKDFVKKKDKTCELGINYVIHHQNDDQVYKMAKFAKAFGAGHIKYTARITKNLFSYHDRFKKSVIRQIHKAQKNLDDGSFRVINKYEDDFLHNMVFERAYRRCPIMQINTVVGADSKVYMCHDKAYVPGGDLGNLKKKTFKEIWFSQKTKKIFDKLDVHEHCRHHCVYDERNILINEIINAADSHVNFI